MRARRAWIGRAGGAVALSAAIFGCERVVDVEIPAPAEPRLVVEGRIERVLEAPSGDQRIRLTTTDAFFSNREPPPAAGALVVVSDDAGGIFPFAESAPGLYTATDLEAVVGRTYSLEVEWNGETFAASAMLRGVPPIDSLYFVFEEETVIVEEEGFRATIDFSDPAGRENYYLWEQLVDGVNIIPPDPGNAFNLVSADEFYDGRRIVGFQPNDEVALQTGQRATVRQIALSREAHDFYLTLFEQNALGSGNPFSIPPANVRGNVRNLSRPDRPALGFFEAAEVSVAEAVVP
ncbi:MAG: DUF4249 domain-containing protein [Gemmatimonadetes bacterium]|nr:DUF4249 domain-containing protein [Gemmatimonadota bacterium]